MPATLTYEVHACKYAHFRRKAYQMQIRPDPHDADCPLDFYVWVAFPLNERGQRKPDMPAIGRTAKQLRRLGSLFFGSAQCQTSSLKGTT